MNPQCFPSIAAILTSTFVRKPLNTDTASCRMTLLGSGKGIFWFGHPGGYIDILNLPGLFGYSSDVHWPARFSYAAYLSTLYSYHVCVYACALLVHFRSSTAGSSIAAPTTSFPTVPFRETALANVFIIARAPSHPGWTVFLMFYMEHFRLPQMGMYCVYCVGYFNIYSTLYIAWFFGHLGNNKQQDFANVHCKDHFLRSALPGFGHAKLS